MIAQSRGLRGFSQIVQEALDAYLTDLGGDEIGSLLALEGSIDEDKANEMRRLIDDARASWRTS